MGQVVHQLHFGCFMSSSENSHVKVLHIAQRCPAEIWMDSQTIKLLELLYYKRTKLY